jgi:LuxR family transcriptional regulator, quorum-sensing system regulator SolR
MGCSIALTARFPHRGPGMQNWQEDNLSAVMSATSENQVYAALLAQAKSLGFDYCAYAARLPLPISSPRIVMHNNYSQVWRDLYASKNFIKVDPTVLQGMQSFLPVIWSDELFANATELWAAAQAHGLKVGWAQSSLAPAGIRGQLTLVRSEHEFSAKELAHKTAKMSWLAHIAHTGMSRFFVTEMNLKEPLTERELEILRWTADGKTAVDVAELMHITERTVNFHINRCMDKLQVNNKLAATVRAALLGLL